MYVADYKKHILVFEHGQKSPSFYFHSDRFNQPNDLAIAADDTLYASDPSFRRATGQIWRITRGPDEKGRGTVMLSDRKMGTTNGVDLSPDGQTLYVSESLTGEILAYRIDGEKLLASRLVMKFDKPELDGLRTDIDGQIFVTRPPNGVVSVLMPNGKLVREIHLRGKKPTNLTFGGYDRRTIFVTQADGGYIENFRVDRPGHELCFQVSGAACQTSPP
jgi:sugar lactone lactonase YvrE